MIESKTLLLILFLHLFADYVVQTRWMARRKSSDFLALLIHATVYGFVFLPIGIFYAWFNAVLHGCTDGITSRATKFFWARAKETGSGWDEWKTFLIMGIDHFVHVSCLVLTYEVISWG